MQMPITCSKKTKAFTLTELVVVIVIIGILAAIGSLLYRDFFLSQKVAVAKANLRVIKSSIDIYKIDHKGNYPDQLLSTPGNKNGLDYYFDDSLNFLLRDPNEPYKYQLKNETDKVVLSVSGPNNFLHQIVITK